jgi:uncharacterized protein DUF6941
MKVTTALLCDAATVREGLLNVLAGGVTRVNAHMYPFPYQGALAVVFTAHPTEASNEHNFQVILQSEDGQRLVELGGQMQAQPGPEFQLGEEMVIPAVLGFTVALPAQGRYSFEVLIDGIHQVTVPFTAMPPPSE